MLQLNPKRIKDHFFLKLVFTTVCVCVSVPKLQTHLECTEGPRKLIAQLHVQIGGLKPAKNETGEDMKDRQPPNTIRRAT